MVPMTEQKLHINLGFKTRNSTVVLAHGTGKTVDGVLGLWEVGYSCSNLLSFSTDAVYCN